MVPRCYDASESWRWRWVTHLRDDETAVTYPCPREDSPLHWTEIRAVYQFSLSEWSHHAYLCMQCESAGRQFQQAEGAPPNIGKTFAPALAQTHTRMSPFPIYLHMLTYFIHTLCHPHRWVQQADPKLVYLEMRKSLSINHKVRW